VHRRAAKDVESLLKTTILFMNVILSSFTELQSLGCFPFQFPFGNDGIVNLQFPVSYIIGDIKGLSLLCGLYGNYNSNCIHQACNCSFEDCDDPYFECTRLQWHEVQSLVHDKDKARLKAMSQHMLDNAFYNMQLCDDEHGIHGSTPVGMLHAIQ
jgi:hypothetical protein